MKKIILTLCFLASVPINAQTNTFNDTSGDKLWGTSTNWSLGIIPLAAHDVIIAENKVCKVNITGAVAKTVTLNAGAANANNAKFLINTGKSLTISDANGLIHSGTGENKIQFNPGPTPMGTVIFTGTYSGTNITIKYRFEVLDKWTLISAPFPSTTSNIQTYYEDNPVAVNEDPAISLATYDGNLTTGNKYTYYPITGNTNGSDGTVTGSPKFTAGKGYSTLISSTADDIADFANPDITLKGKFNTGQIDIDISDAGDGFNLIGNPYTAYVYGGDEVDVSNNILVENNGVLDEQTVWYWDSSADDWVTLNLDDAAHNIAPLQGFFVKAKVGGGTTQTFSFKEAMRNHGSSEEFYRTSNKSRFEIDLAITNNVVNRKTTIRYIDNRTTSFDNGSDSSMFTGVESDFAVYTELVENSNGEKLVIQSLPTVNFEDMVVPVGVNATVGSEIIFKVEAINVPAGYNIYLEDRTNNTLTRLDETDSKYKTTVENTTSDGRFFLHTRTSSVLSTNDITINSVSIYKTSNNNLKITGLQKGKTTVFLYNLLGKKVMTTSFKANGAKEISLPNLAAGIYIVQLETEFSKLNKKIVLE